MMFQKSVGVALRVKEGVRLGWTGGQQGYAVSVTWTLSHQQSFARATASSSPR